MSERTNEPTTISTTHDTGRDHVSDLRFDVGPELLIDARTVSGDLRLRASDGACEVRLTAHGSEPAARLALVECHYDASTNRITIDTKAGRSREVASGSLKSTLSRLFDGFGHDVDVDVAIPTGTRLKFRTASGDLVGSVTLASLETASASGDVAVQGVEGSTEVKSASGDVKLGDVGGDLSVQSVSGDVSLTITSPIEAKINSVSGDVALTIRAGLLLSVDASTVSGNLNSEIALEGDARPSTSEAMLRLKIRTVSGDLTVRRA